MEKKIYEDIEIKLLSKELIEIDDHLKKLKNEIKKLNCEKEIKENKILNKLDEHQEKIYNYNNYILRKNTFITNGSLKPEYI